MFGARAKRDPLDCTIAIGKLSDGSLLAIGGHMDEREQQSGKQG